MRISLETITPRKAAKWLERNVNNRPPSEIRVKEYASAMSEGAWRENGETVKFNCNGDLVDGQHRLHACVSSGASFSTYVVHGVEHDAFDTIDTGNKRTIGDTFARANHKNYSTLASAVRWVICYRQQMKEPRHSFTRLRPTNYQATAALAEEPSLHDAASVACELWRESRLLGPGTLAFLIHETGRKNRDAAVAFWTAAVTGQGAEKGTAAATLHKRLMLNATATAKLHANDLLAVCIKAWNAHKQGKPLGTLKFTEAETFPAIVY